MRLKHAFIYFMSGFLGSIIILGAFFIALQQHKVIQSEAVAEADGALNPEVTFDRESAVFVQTAEQMTYEETPFIGDEVWTSPNDQWILFSAHSGTTSEARVERFYLANSTTGQRKELTGRPISAWEHDTLIMTNPTGELHVFDATSNDSPLENFPTQSTIYHASISPDAANIALSTSKGIALLDRPSGVQRLVVAESESAGHAWFSDNERLLGYRQNASSSQAAGVPMHDLVIWNLKTATAERIIDLDFPARHIQNISWLYTDRLALVETGWDDGKHLYIVDIETPNYWYFGEASEDGNSFNHASIERLGLRSSTDTNGRTRIKQATYWNDVIEEVSFNDSYHRYAFRILDRSSGLYLRQDMLKSYLHTQIVHLDFPTKQETVLFEIDQAIPDLEIMTDSTGIYWMIPTLQKLLITPLTL